MHDNGMVAACAGMTWTPSRMYVKRYLIYYNVDVDITLRYNTVAFRMWHAAVRKYVPFFEREFSSKREISQLIKQ